MKIFYCAISLVLMIGCKTTSESVNSSYNVQRSTIEDLKLERNSSVTIKDSLLSWMDADIVITNRVFGDPDSTGYQPVVSETDYNIKINSGQKGSKDTVANEDENLQNNKKTDERESSDNVLETKTDSRVFRPPEYLYLILFFFIIGFIYRKIRK